MRALTAFMVALVVLTAGPARADFDAGVAAHERADFAAALRDFRPLAEDGHAGAQYFLGFMYEEGDGVDRDVAEAARWYARAAEQGDGLAQFYLSFLYLNGEGVAADYVEALKWLLLATEQDIDGASMGVGQIERLMTPLQIDNARNQAREWRPKSDRAG